MSFYRHCSKFDSRLLRFRDIDYRWFCIANATFAHTPASVVFHPKFVDVPLELDG